MKLTNTIYKIVSTEYCGFVSQSMSKKIYIIEDEEVVRFSLIEIIDKVLDGFEVAGFNGSGQMGLKGCLDLKPDIAIVDVMLPDLNGLEILKIIKKKNPEIKVIIHSGYLLLNIAKLAYEEKVDGILEKPSSLEEFKTAIKTVISGETYFSKNIREKLLLD